ncbi:hypothetical protein BQ8482_110113 [Mesorhizobium delmotii]|uniref:Uncharacterized protein n=1 Tax=Mesorhizobium delmotii TaxID=1631247 RepID=A0A2P9AAP2_9HYPH|nr:hypothetical protein BQ8482_110113 [Mesorhizobium delmotii]
MAGRPEEVVSRGAPSSPSVTGKVASDVPTPSVAFGDISPSRAPQGGRLGAVAQRSRLYPPFRIG